MAKVTPTIKNKVPSTTYKAPAAIKTAKVPNAKVAADPLIKAKAAKAPKKAAKITAGAFKMSTGGYKPPTPQSVGL